MPPSPSTHLSLLLLLLSVLTHGTLPSIAAPREQIRVMSFNIWVGGESGKQPLSQTKAVIEAAQADIVGMQEALGTEKNGHRPDGGREVARMLGWHYFPQGYGRAILSRFPIVTNTPLHWGVTLRTPTGKLIRMFNVHLAHAPYQPYQLLNIPYANAPFIKTADEAVHAANAARGQQVQSLLSELKPALASTDPIFLTGDFNEPSHQDWTPRAARAGKCPLPVPYPSTSRVVAAGMKDAFRTLFPDETKHTGWTWTPLTEPTDPTDRHDRIDFVFYNPKRAKALDSKVIGESPRHSDVQVLPYPSDHRAVVASFSLR